MAISPTVNQFLQQPPQETKKSKEVIFAEKFSNKAYEALSSKYPDLINFIVTFRILDSNIEKGNAVGVFIIKQNKDVVYAPVILNSGNITSIECGYDKKEDIIFPLTKKYIEKIVNSNEIEQPSLVNNTPYINNTRELMRSMFRPPLTGQLVYASSFNSVLEDIPVRAKKSIIDYIQNNKTLLSKLASFYPIDLLIEKLNPYKNKKIEKKAQEVKTLLKNTAIDEAVYKSLSEYEKSQLSKEAKEAIAEGKVVILNSEENLNKIISNKNLPVELITKFNFEDIVLDGKVGKGIIPVFSLNNNDIELIPGIITNTCVYLNYQGEIISSPVFNNTILVSNYTDEVTEADLASIGAVKALDYSNGFEKINYDSNSYMLFVKGKKGFYNKCYSITPPSEIKKVNDDLFITNPQYRISSKLSKGVISLNDVTVLPSNTMLLIGKSYKVSKELKPFKNVHDFINLFTKVFTKLKLVVDNSSYILRDYLKDSSVSFKKEAEVIDHLINNYKVDTGSIITFMNDKEGYFIDKIAFVNSPNEETVNSNLENYNPDYNNSDYDINYDLINSAVELNEPDLFDVGVLASIAGNEDIKTLLVNMFPQFIETTTNLGKVILYMCYHKDMFVDTYGEEQYNNLLNNVRKIFVTLGDIIVDLRQFVKLQ